MTPEDRKLQRENDIRTLMALPVGRRFIFALLDEQAGVASPSFAGSDTHQAAYLEGRRSVGIELLEELYRLTPSEYLLALQETLEERMRDQIAKGTETDGG